MGKTRNYNTRAPQAHDRDPMPEVASATSVVCRKCEGRSMEDLGAVNIGNHGRGQLLRCRDCLTKVIVRD